MGQVHRESKMTPNAALQYMPGPKSSENAPERDKPANDLDKQLATSLTDGAAEKRKDLERAWDVVANLVTGSPTDDLSALLPEV